MSGWGRRGGIAGGGLDEKKRGGSGHGNVQAGVETRCRQPIPGVAETLGCGRNASRGRTQGVVSDVEASHGQIELAGGSTHVPKFWWDKYTFIIRLTKGYGSPTTSGELRQRVGNGRDGPIDARIAERGVPTTGD